MQQSEESTAGRVAWWQSSLRALPGVPPQRVEHAGARLTGLVEELVDADLAPDEAFLVAIKRIAAEDPWSHEVAAADAGELWQRLVLGSSGQAEVHESRSDSGAGEAPAAIGAQEVIADPRPRVTREPDRRSLWVTLAFAVVAGLVVRVPFALGEAAGAGAPAPTLLATYGICAAAIVAAYVCWLRRPTPPIVLALVGSVFAVALLVVNVYPFGPPYDTRLLVILHLGIALWVVIGAAYLGQAWRPGIRWLEFVRFSGELAILYVLVALGGGVLVGLSTAIFGLVGVPVERVASWVVPMGVAGAMVIAAWLVDTRVGAVQNVAPVLSAIFTPLFTLVLLSFLVTIAVSGKLVDLDRQVLIIYDAVLALVFALVVFAVASRDPLAPPRPADVLQVVLIAAAVVVDVVVLAAMTGRIGEYGASPNKLAALGENIVLLVNLAGSGWLHLRFLRGRGGFVALERWQGRYVLVFAGWALGVALAFPPLFGFR